jgi:hypothetical protein
MIDARVVSVFSSLLRYAVLCLLLSGCSRIAAAGQNADSTTVPNVALQVVLAQENANPGARVRASLVITNPSPLLIQNPQLLLIPESSGVSIAGVSPKPLEPIAAYGTEYRDLDLAVNTAAAFANHHFVFLLRYDWKAGKTLNSSAVTATANLQVQRQFEEEAKGLPGGTAALLYLILPIMTIFLSYEVVDSICRGKGLKWPEFKGEYVLPAFLIAIAMNFLLAYEFHADRRLLYADPKELARFLLTMAAIGCAIPIVLLAIRTYSWHRYGFRETDNADEYLRKVLAKFPDGKVQWATGTAEGQWKGVLLPQPDKTNALGARLQVSPNNSPKKGDPDATKLEKIVGEDGRIQQPRELVKLIKNGQVTVALRESIAQDGAALNNYVKAVVNFVPTDRATKPVISMIK